MDFYKTQKKHSFYKGDVTRRRKKTFITNGSDSINSIKQNRAEAEGFSPVETLY